MVEMGGGGRKAEAKRLICRCYVGKAVYESLVHMSEGSSRKQSVYKWAAAHTGDDSLNYVKWFIYSGIG